MKKKCLLLLTILLTFIFLIPNASADVWSNEEFWNLDYEGVVEEVESKDGNIFFDASGYETNCVYVVEKGQELPFVLRGGLLEILLNWLQNNPAFENYMGNHPYTIQLAYNRDNPQDYKLAIYGLYMYIDVEALGWTVIPDLAESYIDLEIGLLDEVQLKNSVLVSEITSNKLKGYNKFGEYLDKLEGVCPRIVIQGPVASLQNVDIDINDPGISVSFLQNAFLYDKVSWLNGWNGYFQYNRVYAKVPEFKTEQLVPSVIINPTTSCKEMLGDHLVSLLQKIYNFVKIGIAIALIALATVDIALAVFAGSEDKIKKAQSKLIKRVLIAIAIFLIPIVLNVLLGIAHEIWPVIDNNICGIRL